MPGKTKWKGRTGIDFHDRFFSMPSFVSSFYLSDLVTSTSGGALQVYLDFCQLSKVWHTISEGRQSMNMPGSHDEVEIKV